jgi:hypothetical protein
MDTIVRALANELNSSLIDFIKSNFKNKKIAVHIYEDEMDETEYLLSDPQHKEQLLKTIKEVNEKKDMKVYSMDELKTMFLNEPET